MPNNKVILTDCFYCFFVILIYSYLFLFILIYSYLFLFILIYSNSILNIHRVIAF